MSKADQRDNQKEPPSPTRVMCVFLEDEVFDSEGRIHAKGAKVLLLGQDADLMEAKKQVVKC